MPGLRVLMATHEYAPFAGGIAVYSEELARAANSRGTDVTVLAPDYGIKQPIKDDPYNVLHFHGSVFKPSQIPRLAARIAREARSHDLVHAADWGTLLGAVAALRIGALSTPILVTLYGTECASLMSSSLKRRSGLARVLTHATDYVAISEFTQSLARRLPGMADRNIRVTPLGVDTFWFEAIPTDPTERRVPGEIRLLTVARLEERKGHTTVIKALARCPELKRRVTYRVIGTDLNDGYLDELRLRARDAGVALRYDGRLSREAVRAAYRWADVMMMPATQGGKRVEGFGLAFLEAAAQGTPSVASDWGAGPEFVKHRTTGWIIPASNPEALAIVIRELATDPEASVKFGEAAREAARSYTWDQCARLTYGPWEQ